jgi:hypothetical protein
MEDLKVTVGIKGTPTEQDKLSIARIIEEAKKQAKQGFQKKSGATSERAELIGRIEKFTNPPRKAAGYRPYSFSRIGDLVAHLNLIDLRDHVVQAEKATNKSQYFWGKLKTK